MSLVQTLLFFALVVLITALAVNLLLSLLDKAEARILAFGDAAVTLSEATGDHAAALVAGQFVAGRIFLLAAGKLLAITILIPVAASLLALVISRCAG